MKTTTWACKIGIIGDAQLPGGADGPMRAAVRRAYFEITGRECDFCFSGWNEQIDPTQSQLFNNDASFEANLTVLEEKVIIKLF